MTTLQQLMAEVSDGWDAHVSSMCKRIIDKLIRLAPHEMRRLTYVILARFADSDPRDPLFQTALTVLTSVENHPLDMRFEFHDELADKDYELSAKEVFECVDENLFIHPRTGEPVDEFQEKLVPFFKASPEFIKMANTFNHAK